MVKIWLDIKLLHYERIGQERIIGMNRPVSNDMKDKGRERLKQQEIWLLERLSLLKMYPNNPPCHWHIQELKSSYKRRHIKAPDSDVLWGGVPKERKNLGQCS